MGIAERSPRPHRIARPLSSWPWPSCFGAAPSRLVRFGAGPVRFALLIYKALVFPIIFVIILKIFGGICIRAPWMRATRKRNERLQRLAVKRKAEVRRVTEGGQEFAVKRLARKDGDEAQDAISRLKAISTKKDTGEKVGTQANVLLSKLPSKVGTTGGSSNVTTSTASSASFAAATPPLPSKSSSAVVDRGGDAGAGIASGFLKSPTAKVVPTGGPDVAAAVREEGD